MNTRVNITTLKQRLKEFFPKRWSTTDKLSGQLQTGIPEIDNGASQGIARKRITEWTGPLSAGKTSILQSAIDHWCFSGLNVIYIDTEGKFHSTDLPLKHNYKGKFWMVRPPEKKTKASGLKGKATPLVSTKNLYVQEAIWSADQFIRSNAFDVVILDLGSSDLTQRRPQGIGYCPIPSHVYARLNRALCKSKSALIIVSDTNYRQNQITSSTMLPISHSCYTRFAFENGTAIRCETGINGLPTIVPAIKFQTYCDGKKQEVRVAINATKFTRFKEIKSKMAL